MMNPLQFEVRAEARTKAELAKTFVMAAADLLALYHGSQVFNMLPVKSEGASTSYHMNFTLPSRRSFDSYLAKLQKLREKLFEPDVRSLVVATVTVLGARTGVELQRHVLS